MGGDTTNELRHHGVKGMRWGKRKETLKKVAGVTAIAAASELTIAAVKNPGKVVRGIKTAKKIFTPKVRMAIIAAVGGLTIAAIRHSDRVERGSNAVDRMFNTRTSDFTENVV